MSAGGAAIAFAAFGLAVKARNDVGALEDTGARWNAARPIIEESVANVSVASFATLLVGLIATVLGLWWWKVHEPTRGLSIATAAGATAAAGGALTWVVGAQLSFGARVIIDDVTSDEALAIFEDYDRQLNSWGLQSAALLLVCAGALVLTMGLLGHLRRTRQQLPTPLPF